MSTDPAQEPERRRDSTPQRLGAYAVRAKIGTVVVGQDGDSPFPLAEFLTRLDAHPAAINVASYVGHGTLRIAD